MFVDEGSVLPFVGPSLLSNTSHEAGDRRMCSASEWAGGGAIGECVDQFMSYENTVG